MSILANIIGKYTQVRRQGSANLVQRDFTVAASQTINQGDWLTVSSGAETVEQALALPGSDNTVTANGSGAKVIGIALTGITTNSGGVATDGSGRTTIPVAILDDSTEVLTRIYNASAAAAEPQDVLVNTDYVLARYRATATTWWYMMSTSTTNAILKLTEKSPESAADEDYGFVWVKAIAAARNIG